MWLRQDAEKRSLDNPTYGRSSSRQRLKTTQTQVFRPSSERRWLLKSGDCLQVSVEKGVRASQTISQAIWQCGCYGIGKFIRAPICERNVKKGGKSMKEQAVRLGPREQQIVELLLQGCDNAEIANQLKMARRTVKAHFNRLFLRFGITGGIKRVKLATLLYRRQACLQMDDMAHVSQMSVNTESSNSLPKA